MRDSNDTPVNPFMVLIGGLLVFGLMFNFLSRIWNGFVDLFPEAGAFLGVLLGIAAVGGVISLIAFGASSAARAGWLQAERASSKQAAFGAEDKDDGDDEDEWEDTDDELDVEDLLERVTILIADWDSIGPEERAEAVLLLQRAAGDEDVIPF